MVDRGKEREREREGNLKVGVGGKVVSWQSCLS